MADRQTIQIDLTDNSGLVREEMQAAVLRALEECGLVAENYAKQLCPVAADNGGTLRDSIAHRVQPTEQAVYIGTNVEYAPYVELGTGKYYRGGRQGWWVYVKGGSRRRRNNNASGKIYTKAEALRIMFALRKKGLDAHITDGSEPKPYLKPAIADHAQQYKGIIEGELRG